MNPLKTLQKLRQNNQGNVTVELALMMSIFLIVMLAGIDFSNMATEKHKLEQYARAGVQYGMISLENAADTNGVTTAVATAAGNDANNLTITAASHCECPGNTNAVCDESCADTTNPEFFLVVTVSKDYEYLLGLASEIGGDITLTGSATARLR